MQNRFLEKQKRLAAESKLQKEKSVTNLPSSVSIFMTLQFLFIIQNHAYKNWFWYKDAIKKFWYNGSIYSER